jgi:DMSO/TMAO reductase YedYZ molybdopterin-dependent catalytic subunit
VRSERVAAILGVALGIAFSVCFATGVLSHLVQERPGWFEWRPRPAGFYRVTQGLHVATGIASIPLLLAKLWVVYPKLFTWPPVRSAAHGVERIALLPLIGGGLFLVFSGLGNIHVYRPFAFDFRTGHYWAAWITMGALVVHVGAKAATTRRALLARAHRHGGDGSHEEGDGDGLATPPRVRADRRAFLATAFGTAALATVFTVGQTVRPLRKLALLAPRRPDVGPQGFPVNRLARSVGLTDVDLASYRLLVDGPGVATPLSLTYDDLRAMPQHTAALPIACVEGWSTTQTWTGVRVRDLLARAGARDGAEATVVSMQRSRRQRTSPVNRHEARDRDMLLALAVNGEPLHPDHGFPVRLIGPNRPGVQQTKWVGRLEVR